MIAVSPILHGIIILSGISPVIATVDGVLTRPQIIIGVLYLIGGSLLVATQLRATSPRWVVGAAHALTAAALAGAP